MLLILGNPRHAFHAVVRVSDPRSSASISGKHSGQPVVLPRIGADECGFVGKLTGFTGSTAAT